jgi:hypothetical protein
VNGEATKNVLTGTLVYGGSSQNAVNAGGYVISPSGLTSTNYNISNFDGVLTVNKIPLSISANALVKTYDGLSYSGGNGVSYSGFVNDEASKNVLGGTLAYTGNAQGEINVGSYTITPGGLSSGNYNISYFDNSLTVNPALLSLVTTAAIRMFGVANPNFTYTLKGFVNGENATTAGVTGTAALSTLANASSPAGVFTITAGAGSLAANNYLFNNLVDASLTINPLLPIVPSKPEGLPNTNAVTNSLPGYALAYIDRSINAFDVGNYPFIGNTVNTENIASPAQTDNLTVIQQKAADAVVTSPGFSDKSPLGLFLALDKGSDILLGTLLNSNDETFSGEIIIPVAKPIPCPPIKKRLTPRVNAAQQPIRMQLPVLKNNRSTSLQFSKRKPAKKYICLNGEYVEVK